MTRLLYTRPLIMALSAIVLIGASMPAFAEDGPKHGPRPGKHKGKMFEEADTNKDGLLTRQEMTAAHEKRLDKMFTELDADKDGKLSKEELDKGREKMRADMKERLKERKDGKERPSHPEDSPPANGE